MYKKFTLLLIALLWLITSAMAQWQPLNPGAGGQVQDVVCDPNTSGHLFLASDMEGIYESNDNGESWHAKGDLLHNRVYAVTFTPGNSNRMYVGTLYGLEVSSDGGNTFSFVELTRKISISAIAVDPNNANIVLAGTGWRDDYDFSSYFGLKEKGNGEVYRSIDGGTTWTKITFDTNDSDRNVFTIQFDKNNSNIVYMGSAKGIHKSTDGGATWTIVTPPSNTTKNRGIALTPDGKTMYAAYTHDDGKKYMYASPTATVSWTQITAGFGINISNLDTWYPEVDSRSTASSHKVIISLQGQRDGLFEGTFIWSGTTLTSYYWTKIWSGTDGYDNGWDNAPPNPRFVHYTPSNWDRAIWSTTNQTIFKGLPNGNKYSWHNQYSIPNYNFAVPHWGTTWPTYSSRGTQSTYTYDVAVDNNYIIQGQGDNGFVESWDGGFSWSNIQHRTGTINLSDVQAVDIADAWGVPTVVAQATGGYGGGAQDGRLYVKKLNSHSPEDQWVLMGGGPNWKGGLPNGVIRDVAVSPVSKGRVYAFSAGNGLYMYEDIGWSLSQLDIGQEAWTTKISNGVADNAYTVKKIAPHPTNKNIVYFNATGGDEAKQGVYKGVYDETAKTWAWTKIFNGSGWDSEVTAWTYNSKVYLFFSGKSTEAGNDGNNFIGALSTDEGVTWTTVLTKAKALTLRTNDWYDALKDDFNFVHKGGIVGYENMLIMCYYDHRMQKTYGIFKGTIANDNSVTWEDWTDDIHFGGLTSAIVAENQGTKYLYVSTAGAGAWRRPLSGATVVTAPAAPTNLTGAAKSASRNELAWKDNASNEMGFKIERKEGTGAYEIVGAAGNNTTTYVDEKLNPNTTYTYRITAYNQAGQSAYTSEVTATTQALAACVSDNLIVNGEFIDKTDPWILYNDANKAASTIAIVNDAGFSGSSAKVDITKADVGDSDIQLYQSLPALQNSKTYQVYFKAKAAGVKNIRVGVLKGEAPWTNYLSKNVDLTTDAKTYGPIEFTMTAADDKTRLDFFLGSNAMAVWLDSVVVREKCSSASKPVVELTAPMNDEFFKKGSTVILTATAESATGTITKVEFFNGTALIGTSTEPPYYFVWNNVAIGTYDITAKATDATGATSESEIHTITVDNKKACVFTNLVGNYEFDNGVQGWIFYKATGAEGDFSIDKGSLLSGANAAKANITTAGTDDSSMQLYTIMAGLKKDKVYEVFFKAKVEVDKPIRVGVLLNEAPWSNYLSQDVTLKKTITTYGPYEFTMPISNDNARLDFFIGKDDNNVYLDSIIVREKCIEEVEDPVLGVHDETSGAKVYPNPVSSNASFFVKLNEPVFHIKVINLLGQTIYQNTFVSEGDTELSVPAMNQAGVYLIKFTTPTQHWTQRLIVK